MSDSKNSSSKTLECMVCGKTFSRGPVDLARHQTAVTLKHLVSTTTSAQFSFGCRKCNIYFTSKEHLSLHRAQSSCGQPLSKPVVVTSTSAIIRPKPVKLVDPVVVKPEESSSSSTTATSSRGTPRHAASVAAAAIAAFHGVGQTKDKPPATPTSAQVPTPVSAPAQPAVVTEIKESIEDKDKEKEKTETSGTRHSTRARHPNPNIVAEGVYTSKPPTPSSAAAQGPSSAATKHSVATDTHTQQAKSKRGRPSTATTQAPVAAPAPSVPERQKSRKKAMTIEELAEFQRTNKRQRVIIPEGSSLSYLIICHIS